ncbi:LOW QUALITY PROTEIN: hypothetical protein IFM46972_09847 [Aspergillus udagawae]|uniref:Uncharacterized protein n=1 Tax=Aspergillus udagawae TaxID=91492 RepID=A0A8H3XMF4_9EURO|nr:LOW QUALITY PROTEIN: hypothetical protein IFM46972_09847 [Aspergillus udagawae]
MLLLAISATNIAATNIMQSVSDIDNLTRKSKRRRNPCKTTKELFARIVRQNLANSDGLTSDEATKDYDVTRKTPHRQGQVRRCLTSRQINRFPRRRWRAATEQISKAFDEAEAAFL